MFNEWDMRLCRLHWQRRENCILAKAPFGLREFFLFPAFSRENELITKFMYNSCETPVF